MEKKGDNVQIIENGIFGKKVVATFHSGEIGKIESEDCNVCKSVNPIYD